MLEAVLAARVARGRGTGRGVVELFAGFDELPGGAGWDGGIPVGGSLCWSALHFSIPLTALKLGPAKD